MKDICDALGLRTDKVAQRLNPEMMIRIEVDGNYIRPNKYNTENSYHPSKGVSNIRRSFWMLAINEYGIYEALFASRKLEARKFRQWSASVMQKLRKRVGLEGYEVMRMTEPAIQEEIDNILDTIFYDEETSQIMQSVTVQGRRCRANTF